ncbi:hypothetical protein EDB85DRAFT_2154010 [Lactarius pseudohatsudake]|nr:hypothetical protein EDB85DRAFT_2154010 [Lactarius pseudohatsudake]
MSQHMLQDQVSMDETNDSPLVATLEYRHFPCGHATRSSSPRPLHMGERKRKHSGSGVQDDHLSKRLNMDSNPGVQGGMEVTKADETTMELSKVKEDLRAALQEIGELHSLIGVLRATNEQSQNDLRVLRALVDEFNKFANNILPECE